MSYIRHKIYIDRLKVPSLECLYYKFYNYAADY